MLNSTLIRAAFTACIAFSLAIIANTSVAARGAPDGFADLVEKLQPAVVNISTVQKVKRSKSSRRPNMPGGSPFGDLFEPKKDRDEDDEDVRRARSLGSGFFISADGLVVTNNHVIEGADEITVRTTDGTSYVAKLLGRAPEMDLALLKVEAEGDVPFVSWADSSKSRVGEWVLAIGNPFNLGGSVTAGIISGRNRDIRSGAYDNFIQTDAPINKGNSGGPLFNMKGEVIGVNTMIFSQTGGNVGIGFSIPANDADRVIKQLKEHGKTRRGWLGVSIQAVTEDLAEGLGLKDAEGAIISSIVDGGPAQKSGLKDGDIIRWWGNQKVEDNRSLSKVVAGTNIGDPVKVSIIRDGEKMVIDVVTGEYPVDEKVAESNKGDRDGQENSQDSIIEGMKLEPMNDALRKRFRIPENVDGIVVADLDRRSEVARLGLRPGAVIRKINLKTVTTIDEIMDAINASRDAGKKSFVLTVRTREGNNAHLPVKFSKKRAKKD